MECRHNRSVRALIWRQEASVVSIFSYSYMLYACKPISKNQYDSSIGTRRYPLADHVPYCPRRKIFPGPCFDNKHCSRVMRQFTLERNDDKETDMSEIELFSPDDAKFNPIAQRCVLSLKESFLYWRMHHLQCK